MSGVLDSTTGRDSSVERGIDLIRRGVALVATEERSGWSGSARAAAVVELHEACERVAAERVRAVGDWDADQSWAVDGALSAPSWLKSYAAVPKRVARQLIRAARLARRHDRVGKALAAGDLSTGHLDVLARAAQGRSALLERDVDLLVDISSTLAVDDFTTAMQHWRSAADDEMANIDARVAFEERTVTLSSTLDGRVELRASLDAEGGETVAKALEAYDRPDPDPEPVDGGPADGPRTLGQRMADGLVQICSEALGERERARHHTPGVDGLVDVDRLSGRFTSGLAGGLTDELVDHGTARPEASCVSVGGAGELAAWLPERCELGGIGPIALDTMTRLACDSAVGRIVMRGRSEVLDVGRRTRVVSPALHRAIEVRDGHCTFPGCDAPLAWCDVHHIVHWAHGGPTDRENCTLLCRRHHFLCHEGGWRLARGPDGRIVIAERGAKATRRRRRGPPDRDGGYDLAA